MESNKHTKMPPSQRAKQFMPFAAVAGLEEALRRKERELEEAMETDTVAIEEEEAMDTEDI